ncbi:hypothetical protein NEMBOFW57_005835 [Staphylotrichum longicolle]|uniref:Uncharacterized protein n=1 Tax=Staphylotrichum longicolle TaxID=669026 RepID=A0AAD4EY96_9PEZI|nr:hypothetical protein NEMBOFW57_005835 [Staphylotrichum longicolle]
MANPLVQYNPTSAGPACRTMTPCLMQVVGRANDDPAAQLSACQSLFGLAQVPTVTLAADPVFSTAIQTSTYTDIIVSTSTVAVNLPTAVTSYLDAVTSIIYSIEPATVTSTSDAVVTVAVTTVIVNPAITTLTTTLSTQTEITTTVTATPSAVAPSTFFAKLSSGSDVNRPLIAFGTPPAYQWQKTSSGTGRMMSLVEGRLSIQNQPNYKMFIRMNTSSYGQVYFVTPEYASVATFTWVPVACSVDGSTLALSCSTTSGLTRFLQCTSTIYMANAAMTPAGCVEVSISAYTL